MRLSRVITAVDAHAAGEPGRVITGGVLDVPGETMFEKRVYLEQHLDGLRKLMLREPRGYPALCCNLLLPPTHPDADAGFVIMEQVEYPAMSGTNTICVATVLVETGMVDVHEPLTKLTLDTPAGLVRVDVEVKDGKAKAVTFENVPAFATHLDHTIQVPELGEVTVDVAWGGMFYVIADADALGVELSAANAGQVVRMGEMIKAAAREQIDVRHPGNPLVGGITIGQLSGKPLRPGASHRNAVIVSTGDLDWDRPETWTAAIDRSPCGTGTCAKMATLHARGKLGLHQDFIHEGLLDTTFTGRLVQETKVGDYDAVVPTIRGRGFITGFANYVVDADDPFPEGFTVGDIWAGGTLD